MTKDIDIHAGEKLRARRQELKMSQKAVADVVGVTFQQIQKYEKGLNRIGATRLYEFCQLLGVNPSYFFEDIGGTMNDNSTIFKVSDSAKGSSSNSFSSNEIIEVMILYNNIKDSKKRRLVIELLRSMQA